MPLPAILILGILGAVLSMSQPRAGEPPLHWVAGLWEVAIEHPRTRCRWEGHVRLTLRGLRITGSGELNPVDRNRRYPPLKGNIDGKVAGDSVWFGFAMGRLGAAEFEGTRGDRGRTLAGRWRGRKASGRWWASRPR